MLLVGAAIDVYTKKKSSWSEKGLSATPWVFAWCFPVASVRRPKEAHARPLPRVLPPSTHTHTQTPGDSPRVAGQEAKRIIVG